MGITRNRTLHTLVARSSRCTTTCLKTKPGRKSLVRRIKSLHLALKLRKSGQNSTNKSLHLLYKRTKKLLLMLVAAEVALAAGKRDSPYTVPV
jgi:hypothetical protein